MLIAVLMERGPSPVFIEVQGTTDEYRARQVAFVMAYEGHPDVNDAEFPPNGFTVDKYTYVVVPTNVVNL
jgi:hypothetical protein